MNTMYFDLPARKSLPSRSSLRRFAAFALLAALLGCGDPGDHVPAPVEMNQGPPPQENVGQVGGSYTVKAGDNVYGIARALNVSARALIDANNLQPPFHLSPGQILVLPGNAAYQVVKGDSLLAVAHKTGVAFATLARMNNLAPPYTLRIGQNLLLPVKANGGTTAMAEAVPPGTGIAQPASPGALPPQVVTTTNLVPLPAPPPSGKANAYTPLAAREASAAAATSPSAGGAATMPAVAPPVTVVAAALPTPAPPTAAASSSEPAVAAAPVTVAAVGHVPSKPLRGFIWPVKGEIIAAFGSPGKGQHNDGINIAVLRGTPVLAAEDGVVAYSGNELRGFGNLLLIKHADGWMSAYAHNDALLVKRGDTVRRGQIIAKAGDSGGVSQPQLHFELRQGTRAVDPEGLLGKPIPEADQADLPDPG